MNDSGSVSEGTSATGASRAWRSSSISSSVGSRVMSSDNTADEEDSFF